MRALIAMRTDCTVLTARHPAHVFRPLPEVLRMWEADGVDTALFRSGIGVVRERYARHGLTRLLPLERVWVGYESSRSGAFGGFHHADQGYRHLQMVAVITMYGPMEDRTPVDPALALLDLLRAYAHDCLHYGSRRRYVEMGGRPVRTQYGINYRRAGGQSYSAADGRGSRHTRNLGVVMEGACDREARSMTRRTAERFGVTQPAGPMGALAYRDVTGTLSGEAAARAARVGGPDEQIRYAASLAAYEERVNLPYAYFLTEFAPGEEDDCHARLVAATISGDTSSLGAWLDERHGPGTFAGLFRTPGYFTPDAAPAR
ncbi:hypothetical protein [Streptomyces sp. NBC_00209]|uniref:hypothetical protein n=1 Tax=Streptomyces sp. NBC_00209 TaxID=2975682 RepID=UPI00324E46C0